MIGGAIRSCLVGCGASVGRKRAFMIEKLLFAAVGLLLQAGLCAAEQRKCIGNLQRGKKKITQANVRYKLWFNIEDRIAIVRVAGREFNAIIDRSRSWKGPWLK